MARLYWGWVVCLSFLFLFTLAAGIAFSYSVIMVPLNQEVHTSITLLSWIGSGPVSIPLLASPVATWLHFRFGCQRTVFMGVFITSISLALTALISSVGLMVLVYGILCGIGLMLIINPPFFLLEEYFPYHHPRHVLATSIIACAFPLATLIFNPLTYVLVSKLTWRITYSIFGLTAFLIGSATTLTFISQAKEADQIAIVEATEEDIEEREKYQTIGDPSNDVTLTKRTKVIMRILWLLASMFKSMGYYTPFVTLVKQMDVLGIPLSQASNAMSVIGACEVFSRLLTSYLGDYIKGKIIYMYVGCTFALCIQNFLGSLAHEFNHLVVYAAGLGIFGGPVIAAMYSSCSEVLAGQHVPALFSVFRVGLGLGGIFGPTLAGAIFDTTRSFHNVFYVNGAIYLASSITYVIIILINKYRPNCVYPGTTGEHIGLTTKNNTVIDHNTFSHESNFTTKTPNEKWKASENVRNGGTGKVVEPFEINEASVSDEY